MPAAVLKGPGRLEVEDVPVPALGADDVLVADRPLRRLRQRPAHGARGLGRAGELAGPRVDRPRRRGRRRRHALAGRATRWWAGRPLAAAPARCAEPAGRRSARSATPRAPARSRAPSPPTSGTRPTSSSPLPAGLDPRAAALAEPLAVALHGIHQGGAQPGDRVLVLGAGPIGALDHRGAAGPRRRRRPLRRAGRAPPGAGRPWSARPRSCTPTDLVVPSIAEPGLVVDDAVDVVLECSGKAAGDGGRPGPARAGRHARARRRGHRVAPVRPEPHPAQRGRHHRGLHLRPGRLRRGPRAPAPGRSRSTRSSSRARCRSTGSSTPCGTWPRAAAPARSWCGRDRARLHARRRGSTTSPCRSPRTSSTPTAGRAHRLLRRRLRLRGVRGPHRGPPPARVPRPQPRAVRVPGRRRRADGGAAARPLRPVGRHPRRLRGGGPARGGVEGPGARRRRPHRAHGRGVRRRPPPPQLLRPLPPPPHGRDPALRVPV